MADDQVTERRLVVDAEPIKRLALVVVAGPDRGKTFEGEGAGTLAVGTAEDNELVLSDPSVSRYHLELRRCRRGAEVTDLGSSNGTFLHGARVSIERGVVPAGTRLVLGETVLEVRDGSVTHTVPRAFESIPGIVGESEVMRTVASQVARLADSAASVLIRGETGTGKELFARAIHDLGDRKDRPFVVVDCGSLPPTLVASELFGHEKGAFTGADERRPGAFERADGGTVFLDEIGELPLAVQPALLGVLERRRFRRLGSERELAVDVRVISATHRDLRAEVNGGTFRADLYYRLAVARVVLPPLRERPEDIPHLVEHFVREASGSASESPFGPQTMAALAAHPWAGNVRELRNVVESALAMGKVSLDEATRARATRARPPQSAPRASEPEDTGPLGAYKDARAEALARFEHSYLSRLIDETGGNASEAARRAKMDRPYLLALLRRHGLR